MLAGTKELKAVPAPERAAKVQKLGIGFEEAGTLLGI